MTNDCYFCTSLADNNPEFFEVGSELFIARWDTYPATPGHALVMPRRHAQYSHELTKDEQAEAMVAAVAAKEIIRQTDLHQQYQTMLDSDVSDKAKDFIAKALEKLSRVDNRPPDAFNDGLNDGSVAGQSIPHFHWHIMPRWSGDVLTAPGGIRHMFVGMGDYQQGVQ